VYASISEGFAMMSECRTPLLQHSVPQKPEILYRHSKIMNQCNVDNDNAKKKRHA
jgi:hypothetical protein